MLIFFFFFFMRSVFIKKKAQVNSTDVPFASVSLGQSTTSFFLKKNVPMRLKYLQLHLPLIVHKILQLDRSIVYTTGNTKYVIRPFDTIYMIKNGKRIHIGTYEQSKNDNDVFTQSFTNGDFLSYGKKIRWSANVRYVGGINGLKVSRIIEGSLGKYDIRVSGTVFTNKLMHEHTLEYFTTTKNHEKEEHANDMYDAEESEEKTNGQICSEYEHKYNEFKNRIESYNKMNRC